MSPRRRPEPAAHAPGPLSVMVLRQPAALAAIAADWRRLESANPAASTVFQSFDWCMAWLEAASGVGEDLRLRVVTVWAEGRVVLIWPLAIRSLFGARVAHWLGEPMTQYGDALVAPSERRLEWLAAAFGEIRSWSDVDALEFRRVRTDAQILALPAFSGAEAALDDAAPYVDLGAARDASGAFKLRSSKTRNALKRKLQALEAEGPVRFDIASESLDQAAAAREALELKLAWLRSKGLASAGLSHPASAALIEALAQRGGWIVSRLTIGDEIAAVELGLLHHSSYYSFLQSYSLRYARSGPGQVLFWKILEHFAAAGIARFDFLAPAYPHKREWASGEVQLHDFLFANTQVGRLASIYLSTIRPSLKELNQRLPMAVRRPLIAAMRGG